MKSSLLKRQSNFLNRWVPAAEACAHLRRGVIGILPGQYFDAETATHYNYLRDYDPAIGRYFKSEPIGQSRGWLTSSRHRLRLRSRMSGEATISMAEFLTWEERARRETEEAIAALLRTAARPTTKPPTARRRCIPSFR